MILSYGYWQRKFGGDRDVLGRTLVIDFAPRQVIGVMPRNFRFANFAPDMLLPQRFPKVRRTADEFGYTGIARLRLGVTIASANRDLARVWKSWGRTDGAVGKSLEMLQVTPNLRPLKKDVVGDVGGLLRVLMGALGLVLLLVCANVANLVLVRAQSRRQEFAIRAALGAGWGRIARELLVEMLDPGHRRRRLGLGACLCRPQGAGSAGARHSSQTRWDIG